MPVFGQAEGHESPADADDAIAPAMKGIVGDRHDFALKSGFLCVRRSWQDEEEDKYSKVKELVHEEPLVTCRKPTFGLKQPAMFQEMKSFFRPEFLNRRGALRQLLPLCEWPGARLDEVIVFRPLREDDVRAIAEVWTGLSLYSDLQLHRLIGGVQEGAGQACRQGLLPLCIVPPPLSRRLVVTGPGSHAFPELQGPTQMQRCVRLYSF